MKTFIVGYISFHDNELKLTKVSAETEVEAMLGVLLGEGQELPNDLSTPEAIKSFAFDYDSMVSAIEI